jgi:hypothetical protein
MTHRLTPGKTSGFAALAAALALLLTSFGADAQAALSKAQRSARASGQAAFFCYAWNCSSRTRITAAYSGSTLRTTWRLTDPHHMLGHGNCTKVANMSINVTSTGAITSRLLSCR